MEVTCFMILMGIATALLPAFRAFPPTWQAFAPLWEIARHASAEAVRAPWRRRARLARPFPAEGASLFHKSGNIVRSTARPRSVSVSCPPVSSVIRPFTTASVANRSAIHACLKSIPAATQSNSRRSGTDRASAVWAGVISFAIARLPFCHLVDIEPEG